jgi:HD-GYP domain-containing protein (c-di-GMP phosphodiesterase class II)
VGLALGYNEQKLKELAQSALLHEVGMFSVPSNIRDKRGALTPDETAQLHHHPIAAFRYLENIRGVSDRVLVAIYQEHEAPNRSGYPNQRPGHLLHDFAKILAVCDAYDAMTSPRAHRSPMLPYHAIEQLVKGATGQRYDFRILKGLLQAIGLFPIGSWVRLSNHRFAKVIANNYNPYDRPTVCVLFDETHQPLVLPEVVNLAQNPDLKIIAVAESECFTGAQMMGF